MKRNRRRQQGKQNARKQGCYSRTRVEPEAPEPERAADNEGLDDEIALLRATIRSLAPRDHQTVRLLTQAADTLTRMVSARHEISKDDARSLAERIDSVLQHYKPLIENRDAGK